MTERAFVDTNVFVCADDSKAGKKRATAQRVLEQPFEEGTAVVSTQVLQEYLAVATRKLGMKPEIARANSSCWPDSRWCRSTSSWFSKRSICA